MNKKAKVLVVDDSSLTQAMLSDILGEAGYTVTGVRTAEAALEVLRAPSFDLVLLDLMLGEADGIDVLRAIRRERATSLLPVIVVTGCDRDEHLVRAFEAGATDFIVKPFSEVAICARIKAALKAHDDHVELSRAREAAEATMRAKSEFLASMSHEIRTPLTAILGFAEELSAQDAQSPGASDRRAAVETILRSSRHLLDVINDTLDISKVEAGRLQVERVPVSICQIVEDVVSFTRSRADCKGLRLDVVYQWPLPETIPADELRIRQILINLVSNAIKFTKHGHVRIATRLDRSGPQPRVQVDVEDTGLGMSAEVLANLFVPYAQADAGTARKFGGTGLGLAISKQLAELLGGSIAATSTLGKGSTFTVCLSTGPLDGVAMLCGPSRQASSAGQRAQAGPITLAGRVLLVEDGPDNQRLIRHILERAGAAVKLAENGAMGMGEALAARDEGRPFDVVLMDMNMPVMDGYEATRRLRAADYEGPILALTAYATMRERDQCLAAGCDDFATKPIDRASFLRLVAEWLAKRPATPSNNAAAGEPVGSVASAT